MATLPTTVITNQTSNILTGSAIGVSTTTSIVILTVTIIFVAIGVLYFYRRK